MKIEFLGAAREVTGSCTLLETGDYKILVDCGMEQGVDTYENSNIRVCNALWETGCQRLGRRY